MTLRARTSFLCGKLNVTWFLTETVTALCAHVCIGCIIIDKHSLGSKVQCAKGNSCMSEALSHPPTYTLEKVSANRKSPVDYMQLSHKLGDIVMRANRVELLYRQAPPP